MRLGGPADTLLGGLATVDQAAQLSRGAAPAPENAEVAEALVRARRLLDRCTMIAGNGR